MKISKNTLNELERLAKNGNSEIVYKALQNLTLDEVGDLLLNVNETAPSLRGVLPQMASNEVQINWTGTSGGALLQQSSAFVNSTSSNYELLTGQRLEGACILDYGCGWGRLIRLMYKFSSPERIYGCDAWDVSLNLCKDNRILASLSLCEEVPQDAPFPGMEFDLIYSFSVFTHLSERTAKAVISSLRKCISPKGLVAVTIRPLEYWDAHDPAQSLVDVNKMKQAHLSGGFAFSPHNRAPIDGDITYGDTSMSIDYIAKNWTGWTVAGEARNGCDPWQIIVFLRPV